MKKIIVLLLTLLIPSITLAQQNIGIEVVGKASVFTIPDTFSLTISIKERGKSASKTKLLVDHKSKQIIDMFVKEGISKQAIDSAQIRMFPIYDKPSIQLEQNELHTKFNNNNKMVLSTNNANQNKKTSLIRFEVGRTITVTFAELTIYDSILDKIMKLGVSHISPIEMSFSEPEKYYQQALFQAIKNAKQKAEDIAAQAGVNLGSLVSMKESSSYSPSRYTMAAESKSYFNSQVTKKSISAQVIARYAIK